MARGGWLGEFEQIVVRAVLRLDDDAYGMEVRREIAQQTGRDASIGAVYATWNASARRATRVPATWRRIRKRGVRGALTR
jgi:hypothetical protein